MAFIHFIGGQRKALHRVDSIQCCTTLSLNYIKSSFYLAKNSEIMTSTVSELFFNYWILLIVSTAGLITLCLFNLGGTYLIRTSLCLRRELNLLPFLPDALVSSHMLVWNSLSYSNPEPLSTPPTCRKSFPATISHYLKIYARYSVRLKTQLTFAIDPILSLLG